MGSRSTRTITRDNYHYRVLSHERGRVMSAVREGSASWRRSPGHVSRVVPAGTLSAMGSHYPNGEEPSDEQIRQALVETVEALRQADIRFLLIGGMSTARFARPRPTN